MTATPRIPPGTRAEIGVINHAVARVIGLAVGGGPPNVFTTLARHRAFRPWLRFAARLMPGGLLQRADSELVILRVAHLCDAPYEWAQHERLARAAGLSEADVARVRTGPDDPAWTARQALVLRAADALHADRDIGDELWSALALELDAPRLIELCLLVGHYEMLAMALNALRVVPDPVPIAQRPWAIRAAERALRR